MPSTTTEGGSRNGASRDLINQYRNVLACVQTMRARALEQDWGAVMRAGIRYEQSVMVLRNHPGYDQLGEAENLERRALLGDILSCDQAVRDLVLPAQARVGQLISGLARQKKLLRSYGANGSVTLGRAPGT